MRILSIMEVLMAVMEVMTTRKKRKQNQSKWNQKVSPNSSQDDAAAHDAIANPSGMLNHFGKNPGEERSNNNNNK